MKTKILFLLSMLLLLGFAAFPSRASAAFPTRTWGSCQVEYDVGNGLGGSYAAFRVTGIGCEGGSGGSTAIRVYGSGGRQGPLCYLGQSSCEGSGWYRSFLPASTFSSAHLKLCARVEGTCHKFYL